MNQNRMIIGLAVAIVLAFFLSTFVYRQFQQASSSQAGRHAAHRGGGGAAATRHARGCQQPPAHSLARRASPWRECSRASKTAPTAP